MLQPLLERAKRAADRPAFVEHLEERRLLSVSLEGGTLTIEGTAGNDTIVVTRVGGAGKKIRVVDNGQAQTFAAGAINRFEIIGGAGNDVLRIDETGRKMRRPARIEGGDGNDTIAGGSRRDALFGGAGDDSISGGPGRDFIEGNAGNDTINGGADDDFVEGGDGNDSILGGRGDDQLYGDAGSDTLRGEQGNDTLGGDDEDILPFEGQNRPDIAFNDVLDGGAGNDWLLGGFNTPGGGSEEGYSLDNNGADTMTGGPGADVIDARGNDDVITDLSDEDLVPSTFYANSPTATQNTVHQHVVLRIYIHGQKVDIPVGWGQFTNLAVIHKHEGGGADTVHLHDVDEGASFRMRDIFQAFGISASNRHIGRHRAGGQGSITAVTKFLGEPDSAFEPIGNFVKHAIRATNIAPFDDVPDALQEWIEIRYE